MNHKFPCLSLDVHNGHSRLCYAFHDKDNNSHYVQSPQIINLSKPEEMVIMLEEFAKLIKNKMK